MTIEELLKLVQILLVIVCSAAFVANAIEAGRTGRTAPGLIAGANLGAVLVNVVGVSS